MLCNHCGFTLADIKTLTRIERTALLDCKKLEVEREKAEMDKLKNK